MEMKPAISCTILRHTKIGTENNGDNKKTHQSVVSQRESVKNDKPTISMSLSHCIHQTLNSKASTRFHSGGLQQIGRAVQQECRDRHLHSFPTRRSSDLECQKR